MRALRLSWLIVPLWVAAGSPVAAETGSDKAAPLPAKVETTPPKADAPASPPLIAKPLPLSIAIAIENGKSAQSVAWIDAQIAEAERIYNKLGVSFRKAEVRRLPAKLSRLETRSDRDALAKELHPGAINVFIVASLRDVDDPRLFRGGVHWAPNGDLRREYVIVARTAYKTTLAHEIGHYFSLQHTQVVNNLMSYSRNGPDIFLSAPQTRKVIASVKSHIALKRLSP